ncbi:AAA family ATPase [Serratia nematodiphila]
MKSLVEKFSIFGLYGYKNITLDMQFRTTIVVAENGVGKTTLLNALNQILTGEVNELCQLDFKSIELKLAGHETFCFSKEEVVSRNANKSIKLHEFVSRFMTVEEFHREVMMFDLETTQSRNFLNILDNCSPLPTSDIISEINFMREDKSSFDDIVNNKFLAIKDALNNLEVIYLPTYRRVEKSVLKSVNEISRSRDIGLESHGINRTKIRKIKEIEFGLSDVELKLKAMSEDVERQSNIGYRSLSASMLEDLITGMGKAGEAKRRNLPDIEDLTRFLIRVASRGQKTKLHTTLKQINILYETGEVHKNTQLMYFLNKLNKIINLTKEKELMIESFVGVCNKYLSVSSDSKILTFDARTLSVIVNDEFTAKPIKLDDLSSGEKQIISLMSHLYLDNKKKLILIDEPELSLSLDWQRMVLPDIDDSPNAAQIVAITHSPFIFDNRLSTNAIVLNVDKVR